MKRLSLSKIAHLFTLLLVILLLSASKGFLFSHPFISASILILFSILYLIIGLHLDAGFFMYPSLGLFVLAYFLAAYHLNPNPYHAPLLSVTVVGLFLFLAYRFRNRRLLHEPFINLCNAIILGFTCYIILNANYFARSEQLVPIISLGFFATVLGLIGIMKRKNVFFYWSLTSISLAFLFLLHFITPIPLWQYSLYLIAFFVCMMHVGTLVHKESGMTKAKPFYWTGFIGLCISPLYSVHYSNILLIIQALYALHFWEILFEIKSIEPDYKKKTILGHILSVMIYPLTIVSLILIVQQHFPTSFYSIGTCLIFALLYLKMAHEKRFKWRRPDMHYLFFFITFLTIAFFTAIFLFFKPSKTPEIFFTTLPLIWFLLLIGRLYSRVTGDRLGHALYKVQYLPMIVALSLSVMVNRTDTFILTALGLSFCISYICFYFKDHWKGFLYAIPFSFSYLYYLFLATINLPGLYISLYLLMPGLAAALMAIYLDQRKSQWSGLFYIWWYTLSIMSIVLLNTTYVIHGYILLLLGLIYLLLGTFSEHINNLHRSCLLTTGNTIAVASLVLIPLTGSMINVLQVYLLAGIGYLILYMANSRSFYLYPIAVSGAVCYSLFFLWGMGWDAAHLGIIPFLLIMYGIWDYYTLKRKTLISLPFKRVGHLTALFFTIMLILNFQYTMPQITLLSLLTYLLIYLLLIKVHKEYDILFLLFGTASIIYFDALDLSRMLSPELHLRLFSIIMLPLCIIGYLFLRKQDEKLALPVFDLVVIISLLTTLISLFHGFVWTTQTILILSAVLFMGFSIILKRDLYIYLTTLCLGLSAYNSLIAVKDIFAIDLVVYALYTLFFIGAFFFLPIFRRILNLHGPRYMISAVNWKSAFFYGAILSGVFLLFFFIYSLQLANFPGFCTKCHFMEPYAEAWAHSSHNMVNCVDCHYEPGIKPLIEGKVNGIVSVVKYVTNTYSIKPNSEINDSSCLRSGCHDKMDLHQEIGFKRGIKFNHEHHLKTLKRGKQLRCTTCHSQIVQGEHLTVTESICFTCHFLDRDEKGTAIGKCISCHDYPKEAVSYQGIEFDHISFLEGKQETLCVDCHSGVTAGNGEVPTERCFSCHTEQNPDLTNPEALHLEHITKKKVECFECHLDIKHGIKDMAEQIKWDCKGCHSASHTVPEKMYLGIGALDMKGDPDPMFTAKVSCQGCHKYKKTIQIGSLSFETTKADLKACDECHGIDSGFTDLGYEWQEETNSRLYKLMALRKTIERPIRDMYKDNREIMDRYQRAEANLQFVKSDGSKGIHNFLYTSELLDSIEKDFEKCLSIINKEEKQ